jgi:CRP-like cAMP-binding protein
MALQVELLKSAGYFHGLGAAEMEALARLVFEKTAQRGDVLQYDGEPAAALYLVVTGAVKVSLTSPEGKEQILDIAGPGDTFNDVPALDDGPSLAGAQAMGPVLLYGIRKGELIAFLRTHPEAAWNAVEVLAGKLRLLAALVEDLSFRHVIGRVARLLLRHAGDGAAPGPRLTQQEMAALVGTAREVVGRSLKTLEEEGIIRLDRHRIVITNRAALAERIESPA